MTTPDRCGQDKGANAPGTPPEPSGLRFYWLENYLFEDVNQRFRANGHLSAFDFFSIIIWKSNRAKSKVAHRLLDDYGKLGDLDAIVRELTQGLWALRTSAQGERLGFMMKSWGFQLPIASAVLAVLWPDEFTVFDVRACEALRGLGEGDFSKLAGRKYSPALAANYQCFVEAVRSVKAEERADLRDKDRHLWGMSARDQLERDIVNGFVKSKL